MWLAIGVARRNCDVWWIWSGGDVAGGGGVCGGRFGDGRSYAGPGGGGGDCCEVDVEMAGLVKQCCLVCRWWVLGPLWPVGPMRRMVMEKVVNRWQWRFDWELEWWDPVADVVVESAVSH